MFRAVLGLLQRIHLAPQLLMKILVKYIKKLTVYVFILIGSDDFERMTLKALSQYGTWLHQRKLVLNARLASECNTLGKLDKLYKDRSNCNQQEVLQTLQKILGGTNAKQFLGQVDKDLKLFSVVQECLDNLQKWVQSKGGNFVIE